MLGLIDLNKLYFLAECGLIDTSTDEAKVIGNLTSGAVFAIQVFVPVILIIMGMWDLGKAIMNQKEDDIKKAQGTFITRLVSAVIVFLVITIVKLVVGIITGAGAEGAENDSLMECINFFISGS